MSETTITGAQLEKIGEYVRGQLPQWLQENGIAPLPDQSTDHPNDLVIQAPIALAERIVRAGRHLRCLLAHASGVEEALKTSNRLSQDHAQADGHGASRKTGSILISVLRSSDNTVTSASRR